MIADELKTVSNHEQEQYNHLDYFFFGFEIFHQSFLVILNIAYTRHMSLYESVMDYIHF